MKNQKLNVIAAIALLLCLVMNYAHVAKAAENTIFTDDSRIKVQHEVVDGAATVTVDVEIEDEVINLVYLYGSISRPSNPVWEELGTDITETRTFETTNAGDYSFRVIDSSGNMYTRTVRISLSDELKAVWISYLEFKSTGYTEKEFRTQIQTMFDNVVDLNMNAVIVQVRPFSDAMYPSKYYPWSKYVSGTQGTNPGFDPLEIMVEEAHKRDLQFHAWLNPYRVTANSTDVTTLAKTNPARKWLTDSNKANDRNVLAFDGKLYYNPASAEARQLIYNGIKEIVSNYDVDGIHLDDYFYPTLGSKYETNFDAPEYQTYVASCKKSGAKVLSIADWRRRNVNWLVKNIYSNIKKIDNTVEFGISPGGFLDTLQMNDRYYTDIKTWMSKSGYIDYICPQIYWSNSHSKYPFNATVDRWSNLLLNDEVKLYIGIPTYKAGSNEEAEFKTNTNILADMVEYCRDTEIVNGFMFYRYDYFFTNATKKAVANLMDVLVEE